MMRVFKVPGWCVLLAAAWCMSAPAVASDGFAQRFPLRLEGSAPFYSVPLSGAVYAASQRTDLGDLRVLNAAGNAVPYSLETPREPRRVASTLHAARWLQVRFGATASDGAPAGIAKEADGSLHASSAAPPAAQHDADVIDGGAAAQAGRLGALVVHVRDDNYQGRVHVDASADLRHWQDAGDAQLLKVHYNAGTLNQDRVELSGTQARYLRLHWLDGAPHVDSIDAAVYPSADAPLARLNDAQREWRESIVARPGLGAGEYFFTTGRSYPVDRLRIGLPQPDTVVPVLVYSRASLNAPWREVARATLFRLHNGAVEQSNTPLELKPDTDRLWRVVIDTRDGGIGAGTLSIAAGWRPATLSFAAQGGEPFTVAVGNVSMPSAAVSRAALLKGAPSVGVAHFVGAPRLVAAPPASAAGTSDASVGAMDRVHDGSNVSRRRNLIGAAAGLALGIVALLVWWLVRARRRLNDAPGRADRSSTSHKLPDDAGQSNADRAGKKPR